MISQRVLKRRHENHKLKFYKKEKRRKESCTIQCQSSPYAMEATERIHPFSLLPTNSKVLVIIENTYI